MNSAPPPQRTRLQQSLGGAWPRLEQWAGNPWRRLSLLLIVLLALCTVLFMRYLHLRLEGQTGDTLGAVQQGAEIVILIVATTILP